MYLQCPKCEKPNEYPHISTPGIPEDHNEHPCRNPSCGQLLMWDYPQVYDAPYVPVSEPKECHHAQLKKLGAVVPTLV
jgi:hypothetical protein